MFNKLKEFKDLGKLGKTEVPKEQVELQNRINEVCEAINTVLKEKSCTVRETFMAFQAIQNALTTVLQSKTVKEVEDNA